MPTETVGQLSNFAGCYAQSFGALPNETVYQQVDVKSLCRPSPDGDFKNTIDLRSNLHQAAQVGMKALTSTTGGNGSTDKVMVPIYVDPQVVDLTRKETPLVEMFPRVTNLGRTADFNQITAKGGAFTQIEDASMSETNTTVARQSTAIKYLYAVGRVTGQAQATIPSYILQGFNPTGGAVSPFANANAGNAKQLEVLVKTREIRELEENLIVAGNATTTGLS